MPTQRMESDVCKAEATPVTRGDSLLSFIDQIMAPLLEQTTGQTDVKQWTWQSFAEATGVFGTQLY